MSDDTTPTDGTEEKPKRKTNAGWFKPGDPRRATNGARRKTKDGKTITKLYRDYTEEGLALLLEMMRDPDTNRKVRLECIKELNNRGWGTATQQIQIDANVQHNHTAQIDPAMLSAEMREQLMMAFKPNEEIPLLEYQEISEGDDDTEYDD